MKNFINVTVPVVLTMCLVLLLSTGASNSFGQMMNQTQPQPANQTQPQPANQTQPQPANQTQPQPANQTQPQPANQTQPQPANQTQPQPANQTQPQQDPKVIEKLLNYTNIAILALNEDNTEVAQDSLQQIQTELINATGKQVVVVPAPAVSSDESDEGSDE